MGPCYGAAVTVAVGPREQRRLQVLEVNREHLLDAAEEVFGDKGFQDATIKEIAERAEFSVGAVYGIVVGQGGPPRPDVEAAGGRAARRHGRRRGPADGGLDGLHRMADLQVEFFRRHPHFGRLWVRWAGPAGWAMAPASLGRSAPTSTRDGHAGRAHPARAGGGGDARR